MGQGRPPRPYYWGRRQQWQCTIRGRRYVLARGPEAATRAEALREFHRLMALGEALDTPVPDGSSLSVDGLCAEFLAWTIRERDRATAEGYDRYLKSFVGMFGEIRASEVTPLYVDRWLAAMARPRPHPGAGRRGTVSWGATSKRNAITALKRAYNWARKMGLLKESPIADVERPPESRREAVMTPEQARAVIDAVPEGDPFRDLLVACYETGCRPGEAMRLTAAMVVGDTWEVPNKTRRKTGIATRTIFLPPEAAEVTARLAALHPEGPIFRNRRGRPWTRHAVAHRLGRLRARLGLGPEVVAYALRHGFVTDALEAGVPIAVVAELAGHRDAAMVSRVYSRLSERRGLLHSSARRVRGGGQDATPGDAPGTPPGTPGGPPPPP